MPDRAAIITGASRGIGLAIAQALGEDGYALTVAARKPEPLERAAAGLRDKGLEVEQVAANLVDEEGIRSGSALAGSTCLSTTPASASERPLPSSRPSTSTCRST